MSTTSTFRWTFAVASSAWFAFALDRLVVATALPSIQVDLGATPADLVWVVNAYTLTFAVLLLTGAALGDRFGRRRVFCLGVALFALGSAGAALAPGVGALVAARAAQGVGGAMFVPLSLTMLTAATEPARRGAVLGAWGGVGALGAAIGPLVGGGLVGAVGWRSIFWLNVPLGLVLVPLAARRLRESRGPQRPLDSVGVVLGSAGLFGAVWALVRGRDEGWTSAGELLAFAGSAIALAAFASWELRTPHPLLPLEAFRSRRFALAGVATCAMYAAMFGMLFLISQLLQTGLGASPLQAGSQLLPMAVMPMLLAPVGGLMADRVGPRPLIIAGLVMVAAAFGAARPRRLTLGPLRPVGTRAGAGRGRQRHLLRADHRDEPVGGPGARPRTSLGHRHHAAGARGSPRRGRPRRGVPQPRR